MSAPATAPPVAPAPPARAPRRLRTTAKTLGALALLQAALPANLALTAAALLRSALVREPARPTAHPRTIMISGGKMTKALQLARSFHAAGHRVVLVESARYRLTGHRFSRAVDRFRTVPEPHDPTYPEALLRVVREEGVDVYVPVCSPASSYYDALAKPLLEPHCEVLHGDLAAVAAVDDKYEFATRAAELGLPVPATYRITDPADVVAVGLDPQGPPHILKSIPYDPVNRLDLTPLPRPTEAETAAFAASKPISPDRPWILQEFVGGTEYCTHSLVRDGAVQVWACCASSPFQVNYEMVDKPQIEDWVRRFAKELRYTGQLSFDFIEAPDGRLAAIECNPRTHSAVTLFHDHPLLARAYLQDTGTTITPLPSARPTYWAYHELWRVLSDPRRFAERLRVVLRGTDAVFDWADPLPFLLLHHLHVPALLLRNLVRGRDWVRVDFNIGKLVEPAGD
jgi:predicted ATP-grasp superfamily ATP-dependent carboligase